MTTNHFMNYNYRYQITVGTGGSLNEDQVRAIHEISRDPHYFPPYVEHHPQRFLFGTEKPLQPEHHIRISLLGLHLGTFAIEASVETNDSLLNRLEKARQQAL